VIVLTAIALSLGVIGTMMFFVDDERLSNPYPVLLIAGACGGVAGLLSAWNTHAGR
jgi:hypothetical protein